MVNSVILKKKKIKLNIVLPFRSTEYNLYRSNYFYNYSKYRKRKWSRQRNKESDFMIYRRYAHNITYIPNYSYYINTRHIFRNITVKINKFNQLLNFKSKFELGRRLAGYFHIRKKKDLKDFLVYKYINLHFNVFDSNYEVFLLRLGIIDSIKEARRCIKKGVIRINQFLVKQTRHFLNLDSVRFTKNCMDFYDATYRYNYKKRKYDSFKKITSVPFFNYVQSFILDQLKYDFDPEHDYRDNTHIEILEKVEKNKFLGILPFTSSLNYENYNFVYFNTLVKNQWHFFWDFFVMKKFIQYNR